MCNVETQYLKYLCSVYKACPWGKLILEVCMSREGGGGGGLKFCTTFGANGIKICGVE